jgi:hypothetical protein
LFIEIFLPPCERNRSQKIPKVSPWENGSLWWRIRNSKQCYAIGVRGYCETTVKLFLAVSRETGKKKWAVSVGLVFLFSKRFLFLNLVNQKATIERKTGNNAQHCHIPRNTGS